MILAIKTTIFFIHFFFVENNVYLYSTQDGLSVEYYDCVLVPSLYYCLRPTQPIDLIRDNDTLSCEKNGGKMHYFDALRSNNISISTILYGWKSTIERVEQYSRYLRNTSQSNGFLCQCVRQYSFGKSCEYQLPVYPTFQHTLDEQLQMRKYNPEQVQIHGDVVCYLTLKCDSGLLCLDWREICDGIQHCTSGFDEENCDLLEMNLCDDDEYRCMNGMCIPEEYFLDGELDCLDWSDEIQFKKSDQCAMESVSSMCDDHFCPPNYWSCGDGQCILSRLTFQTSMNASVCVSRRDQYFMCEMSLIPLRWTMPNGRCHGGGRYEAPLMRNYTERERCEYLLRCALSRGGEKSCPRFPGSFSTEELAQSCSLPLIQYPNGAIMAPFIFFYYDRSENWTGNLLPIVLINGTVKCRGSFTSMTNVIEYNRYMTAQRIIEDQICKQAKSITLYENRNATYQCHNSNESADLCNGWNPCMSVTRMNDGFVDCFNERDEKRSIGTENWKSCARVRRHRFRCSITESTCLSVMALGNQKKDCENQFDRFWFGTKRKLSEMNCNDRSNDECFLLRQYIEQSSTSINHTEILSQMTIPFRSYCDTFWDLQSREDENITECKQRWICHEDQEQCRTGQCIDPRWRNDHEKDCADASEEEGISRFIIHSMQREVTSIHSSGNKSFLHSRTCNQTGSFVCLSPRTSHQQFICINRSQLGDSHVDCAGAIDESNTLQHCSQPSMLGYYFRCPSTNTCIPYFFHCQVNHRCPNRTDDQHWCARRSQRPSNCSGENDVMCFDGTCLRNARCNDRRQCPLGEDEYMCDYPSSSQSKIVPYREEKEVRAKTTRHISRLPLFPIDASITELVPDSTDAVLTVGNVFFNPALPSLHSAYWCNRGVGILSFNQSIVCFCPPQYFGDKCQYHSDRLLILLHLDLSRSLYATESDPHVVLKLLVLFLYNNQTLMTHEFHVRPTSEIKTFTKKVIHFLFSNAWASRQQRMNRYFNRSNIINIHPYSIRIEAYIRDNTERASLITVWQYPIHFDYLPVFRLAKVLRLTSDTRARNPCLSASCHPNEECQPLMNDPSQHVCLCKRNFAGENCSIEDQRCTSGHCAPASICKPDYRRLLRGYHLPYCICPFNRHGDRCDIEHEGCRYNPCRNGASCFPTSSPDRVECFCTKKFYGSHCQLKKSSIRLFLNENLHYAAAVIQFFDFDWISLDLLLVHQQVHRFLPGLIEYDHDQRTAPSIVLAKLYLSADDVSPEFYLLSLSTNVTFIDGRTQMSQINRCPHVRTLSNSNRSLSDGTLYHCSHHVSLTLDSSPIRYHDICLNNDALLCFRDNVYLCTCVDKHTRVECFRYNHELDRCSHCRSGGRCLRGDHTHPRDFVCLCPSCHSGGQCQFISQSFTFTLDQLFSTDLTSTDKRRTISLLIVFSLLGFIFAIPNNLFSFVTFRRRPCLRNGIGHYLLFLSVINQITITLLASRLCHLTMNISVARSTPILDHLFCKLLNYLLTCCIRLAYWLGSFVALERVYTTIFFNKHWLKQPHIARLLIISITVIVCLSSAYELVFIKSFSGVENGSRVMCITEFPTTHQSIWILFHQFVFVTHLVVPLLINLCCTCAITAIVIKTKMNVRRKHQCKGVPRRR